MNTVSAIMDILKITNLKKIVRLMQKILRREAGANTNPRLTWGISLDPDGSILSIELISKEGLDEHSFLPVQILSLPLQKQAASFILVHNHPDGRLEPTESDKAITAKLIYCGTFLQMPLLDHLIIDGNYYYSFRQSGLLEQLEKQLKDGPSPKETIQTSLENVLREKQQLKHHIVQLMQEADYPIEAIMSKTGLSKEVILALWREQDETIDPDSHYESANAKQ